MAIQKLATVADVGKRLGRTIPPGETEKVENLLEEASVKVRSTLRCTTLPDPVPDEVVMVVSRMVARAISAQEQDTNVAVGQNSLSATMGPFGFTRSYDPNTTDGGVWLTRQDRDMLRPISCRGQAENVATHG